MCEQQRRQDIYCVYAVEFIAGDGAEGRVIEGLVGCHSGVVDEYVDLECARGVVGFEEGLSGVYDFRTCRRGIG